MKNKRLEDMVQGWFVGPFAPCAHWTGGCEVAVKRFKAGDSEANHLHRIATEITVVVEGRLRMAGREWAANDIIVLEPEDATDFVALTDAVAIIVKTPGAVEDTYFV